MKEKVQLLVAMFIMLATSSIYSIIDRVASLKVPPLRAYVPMTELGIPLRFYLKYFVPPLIKLSKLRDNYVLMPTPMFLNVQIDEMKNNLAKIYEGLPPREIGNDATKLLDLMRHKTAKFKISIIHNRNEQSRLLFPKARFEVVKR